MKWILVIVVCSFLAGLMGFELGEEHLRQLQGGSQYYGPQVPKFQADLLQKRAETCEAKFSVMTIMFEPRPAVSIPLLNGLASVTLGNGEELVPVFYAPAQVTPNSPVPGAQYRWISLKNKEVIGTYPARTMAQGEQAQ